MVRIGGVWRWWAIQPCFKIIPREEEHCIAKEHWRSELYGESASEDEFSGHLFARLLCDVG